MKNLFFIAIAIFTSGIVFGQESCTPDQRIFSRYTNEKVQQWQNNEPQKVCYLNYELENGYKIAEVPEGKPINQEPLVRFNYKTKEMGDIVQEVNLQNFNLYEYYYERDDKKRKFYAIGNTGYILIITPNNQLLRKFNQRHEK